MVCISGRAAVDAFGVFRYRAVGIQGAPLTSLSWRVVSCRRVIRSAIPAIRLRYCCVASVRFRPSARAVRWLRSFSVCLCAATRCLLPTRPLRKAARPPRARRQMPGSLRRLPGTPPLITVVPTPPEKSGRSSGLCVSRAGNTSSHAYSFGGRSKAVSMKRGDFRSHAYAEQGRTSREVQDFEQCTPDYDCRAY